MMLSFAYAIYSNQKTFGKYRLVNIRDCVGMIITPTEQKIYRNFYKQKIFSLDEAIKLLKNNYRAALISTKNLVSKKYIKKIRRGLYYIIPYEQTDKWLVNFEPDKILIASKLIDGFISHDSALEIHGVTQKSSNKVYICSQTKIPDVKIDQCEFFVIKTIHYFGFAEVVYKGMKINVSDKERAIIDCLRNVNYSSDLVELIQSISQFKTIDFEVLFEYLKKVDEVSLYSRVGYVMDILKFKLKTPDWFRQRVQKKLTERTYYLDHTKKGSSRHVAEWKLMVPDNILKTDF